MAGGNDQFSKGGFMGRELAATNPYLWVQEVLLPKLMAHGYNTPKALDIEITKLFGNNRVAAGMISYFATQQARYDADQVKIAKAMPYAKAYTDLLAKNPTLAKEYVDAQLSTALTQLSKSVIPDMVTAADKLAELTGDLGDFLKAHQNAARGVMYGGAGVMALIGGRLAYDLGAYALGPLGKLAPTLKSLGVAEAATTAETVGLGTAALRSAAALMEVAGVGYAAYEATKWLLSITGMTNKMAHDKSFQSADRAVYWMTHTPAQYKAIFGNQGHSADHVFTPARMTAAQKHDESWSSLDPFAPTTSAPPPVIHNHFYVDGNELAVHLANSQQNTAPSGVSQYSPFSTMPYPQNPAPTGG
jgi:hypothetical protein